MIGQPAGGRCLEIHFNDSKHPFHSSIHPSIHGSPGSLGTREMDPRGWNRKCRDSPLCIRYEYMSYRSTFAQPVLFRKQSRAEARRSMDRSK